MTPFSARPHPQLRCPYTLKPLADVAELRSEPIVPLILGGPPDFDVLVDCQPAAGHPTGDDNSFGDNALLLMMRARDGMAPPASAGRFGQSGLGLIKKNPFEGLPMQAMAMMSAGMAKVAYLAAFEFLGDQFLDDPLNLEWRNLMMARSTAEVAASKLRFMPLGPKEVLYEAALLPDLGPHEHAITICNFQQNTPLVALKLFGCLSHVFRVSQSGTYGLELLEGQIAICDSVKRTIRTQSFMPHFLSFASRYHVAGGDLPPFLVRTAG
ncbi:MAG: hypothetical protein JSR82_03140 [Verrucomicrobia bacterium]|nr:hypothetical protein [Verrucomicrobiota bacterium]